MLGMSVLRAGKSRCKIERIRMGILGRRYGHCSNSRVKGLDVRDFVDRRNKYEDYRRHVAINA